MDEDDTASTRVPLEILIEILSNVSLVQDVFSTSRVNRLWSSASFLAQKDLTFLRIRPSLIQLTNFLTCLTKRPAKPLDEISINTNVLSLKDVELLKKVVQASKNTLKILRFKVGKVQDRKIPTMLLNLALQCPKLVTLLIDVQELPEKKSNMTLPSSSLHANNPHLGPHFPGGNVDVQLRVVQSLKWAHPEARIRSLTLNSVFDDLSPDSLEKDEFKAWISEIKYLYLGRDPELLHTAKVASILESCKETLEVFSLMSDACMEFFFDGFQNALHNGPPALPSQQLVVVVEETESIAQGTIPLAQAQQAQLQAQLQIQPQAETVPAGPALNTDDGEDAKVIRSWEVASQMNITTNGEQLAVAMPVDLPCLRSLNFRHEQSPFMARVKAPILANISFGAGFKPLIKAAPYGNLNSDTLANIKSLQICANLVRRGGINEEQLCAQLEKWRSLERLSLLNRDSEIDYGLGDKDEEDGEYMQIIPAWASKKPFKSINDGSTFTKYLLQRLTPSSELNASIAEEGGSLVGIKLSTLCIAIKDQETAALLIKLMAARIAVGRNLSEAKIKEAANTATLLQPWCGLIQPSQNSTMDIFPEIQVIDTVIIELEESNEWEIQKLRGELPIEVVKLIGTRESWNFNRTWSIPQYNEGKTNFLKDWRELENQSAEPDEESMSERIRRLEQEAENDDESELSFEGSEVSDGSYVPSDSD